MNRGASTETGGNWQRPHKTRDKRNGAQTQKNTLLAPGYFQQVMDEITSDLPGVAVYLDDILCSGATAEAHLQNLRLLLERLRDKGLRCRLEKCNFAQPQVVYLGHMLSSEGIHRGP